MGGLTSERRYVIQVVKRPGRVGRLHNSLDVFYNLAVDTSIMVDMKFFRVSTVMYGSRS